jgi:hypothetical protein
MAPSPTRDNRIQRGDMTLPPAMAANEDAGTSCDMQSRPEFARISAICKRISCSWTRGELGAALAREIGHYSMYDLQVICGRLQHEISRLPSPYRESIRPFFLEQLFGMHHRLLLMDREGTFLCMTSPLPNHDLFLTFFRMVPEGCFCWETGPEYVAHLYSPFHRLFYYLVSAFSMFVLELPGHPVGTPFPGGFRVEQRKSLYVCPIRDKEQDVFYSICNFCPAVQDEKN